MSFHLRFSKRSEATRNTIPQPLQILSKRNLCVEKECRAVINLSFVSLSWMHEKGDQLRRAAGKVIITT